MQFRCSSYIGIDNCYVYGDVAEHANAASVGNVNVHGGAAEGLPGVRRCGALFHSSASEHAVASRTRCLHCFSGGQQFRMPLLSTCPCGRRFVARIMRLARTTDPASP